MWKATSIKLSKDNWAAGQCKQTAVRRAARAAQQTAQHMTRRTCRQHYFWRTLTPLSHFKGGIWNLCRAHEFIYRNNMKPHTFGIHFGVHLPYSKLSVWEPWLRIFFSKLLALECGNNKIKSLNWKFCLIHLITFIHDKTLGRENKYSFLASTTTIHTLSPPL